MNGKLTVEHLKKRVSISKFSGNPLGNVSRDKAKKIIGRKREAEKFMNG